MATVSCASVKFFNVAVTSSGVMPWKYFNDRQIGVPLNNSAGLLKYFTGRRTCPAVERDGDGYDFLLSGPLVPVLQQVTGLTIEFPAERVERREPNCPLR